MNYLPKSLATGFVLALFASSAVFAATHPVTGETLAEDRHLLIVCWTNLLR